MSGCLTRWILLDSAKFPAKFSFESFNVVRFWNSHGFAEMFEEFERTSMNCQRAGFLWILVDSCGFLWMLRDLMDADAATAEMKKTCRGSERFIAG